MTVIHPAHGKARAPEQVVLRFGTFLLACVLLALHWGRSLSQELADICQLIGLCGLAFYFALEAVADQRARQEQQKEQQDTNADGFMLGDQRLSRRLSAEKKMASIIEKERLRGSEI